MHRLLTGTTVTVNSLAGFCPFYSFDLDVCLYSRAGALASDPLSHEKFVGQRLHSSCQECLDLAIGSGSVDWSTLCLT